MLYACYEAIQLLLSDSKCIPTRSKQCSNPVFQSTGRLGRRFGTADRTLLAPLTAETPDLFDDIVPFATTHYRGAERTLSRQLSSTLPDVAIHRLTDFTINVGIPDFGFRLDR